MNKYINKKKEKRNKQTGKSGSPFCTPSLNFCHARRKVELKSQNQYLQPLLLPLQSLSLCTYLIEKR